MKRFLAVLMSIMMVLASCAFAEDSSKVTMVYPEDMQALGYTEPLVLDHYPERVVVMSAAPVLALYELGVNMVGVVKSSVVTWPDEVWANASVVQFSAMSTADFDAESVVNLEPDLVIMGVSSAATAGATIESLGIPVYYVYSGHVVSYDSIKMQTEALIESLALTDESKAAGQQIMDRFAAVEARCEAAKEVFGGKTVMVLQSSGDSHYIQTSNGTLGSMAAMIGFTNVYENDMSTMAQLDFEQALDYNPDVVMCVGMETAEGHKASMEASYAANPEYWNQIKAIADSQVIYLPVDFCSTAGINVINNINDLIDTVSAFYGVTVG